MWEISSVITSAFRHQFGWEPKIKFEEGIKRSLEYFRTEVRTLHLEIP